MDDITRNIDEIETEYDSSKIYNIVNLYKSNYNKELEKIEEIKLVSASKDDVIDKYKKDLLEIDKNATLFFEQKKQKNFSENEKKAKLIIAMCHGLLADMRRVEQERQASVQKSLKNIEAQAWFEARLCGWVAGITLILFVAVSAVMGYRGIAWPLLRLRDRTLAIAQGEFSISVEEEKRRDEIGAMAAALEEIRLKLQGGREDILTSLANRTALQDVMRSALALSDAQNIVALIYLDLDNFKQVNDRYGHNAGDELLRLVAQRLRVNVRKSDLVARLGGDEFVVFCSTQTTEDDVMTTATRIAADLSSCDQLTFGQVTVSASVGVAIAHVGSVTSEQLLRQADCAMYAAKTTGKGCCAVYEPWMLEQAEQRQAYESALRRAVGSGEFYLMYQPVIDWNTHAVVSFEALLRWEHSELGTVPPNDFIPLAEEIGLMFEIDRWVMKTACMEAVKWPDNLIVSVNVSPKSFIEADLLDSIYAALKESGLPPERLEIEITETAMIEDLPAVHAIVTALRGVGVLVAIDDLGVGYSSLSFLRSIPVTRVKMDRSFIAELGRIEAARAIIQGIVQICHDLSIDMTAEGVETASQTSTLQGIGCYQHQGYYISRPMLAEHARAFVADFGVRTIPSLQECLQGTWSALRVEALGMARPSLI
ncbi:putative diguanylate cyclase [Neokomagataea thailandica NBRC 106555]|uniref:Diguanylate cyclase n=1 Tax=Neokomagataea thailandica NBRC 106555 TaxID=1223520 RepID=A0ABQ0QQT3_9PROT|nr:MULTISPECIES: EAL domain-containing protein [Neokomagataea]GBR53671.1 putative diguanylate cyclase [Neokomagataea thailandica NBRC 106555]